MIYKGTAQLNKIQSEIDSLSNKIKPLNLCITQGDGTRNKPIISEIMRLDNRRKELQKRRWNVLQYIKRVN